MSPLEIVKNYNKLEDTLFEKSLRYLDDTFSELGWGKQITSIRVIGKDIRLLITDIYEGEKWVIYFNEGLEIINDKTK